MKVLVTGGTGAVGRAAVERLVRHGWDVLVIGRRAGVEVPGAAYAVCDVTDYDRLRDAVRGCGAVVHLAAIAQPTPAPGPEVFRVNVTGTFNVFAAAAAEGIRRVVQASSINAFGCAWGIVDLRVEYLPIDEEHPTFATDPYSFSKNVVEEIGRYWWRREGISSAALRLPAVRRARAAADPTRSEHVRRMHALLDELAALPAGERRRRLDDVRRRVLACRRRRPLEFGAPEDALPRQELADPLFRAYFSDRANFWAAVDERDSAQAIEKALTADYEGSHALFINDDHNWLDYDSRALARLFFPEVDCWKRPVSGSGSLVSIDEARGRIGFAPEHSIVPRRGGPDRTDGE